jgi:hypothetical protein
MSISDCSSLITYTLEQKKKVSSWVFLGKAGTTTQSHRRCKRKKNS